MPSELKGKKEKIGIEAEIEAEIEASVPGLVIVC